MKHPLTRISAWLVAAAVAAQMLASPMNGRAATAPGTQVTNNATAVYKDAAGNSYNTTSNTVTITVQNAPTLTDVAGTGSSYAPGQVVTDTFTLTNTGNGPGTFQISGNASAPTSTSDAVIGGTDASSATLGNNAATCTTPVGSQSAPCKYAATIGGTTYYFTSLDGTSNNNSLDYWLANTAGTTAAGASITIAVYYALANTASTSSANVSSQIYATVAYAAAGSAPAELSSSANATETDPVAADARLDLYKSSSQNATTGDITYTVSAHNGGAFSAKDLLSVKALLGAPTAGIFLSDKVPQFGGSPLNLSNSGTVAVTSNATYGFASGATTSVYYTTSSNGTSGWTKATGNLPTSGVTYIGVFVSGGSCSSSAGFELCADSSHPTTPGTASVASAAAVQFSFTVVQPTGPGAGTAGSVTNLANGVIGDNQPTEHILGPGIATGTADSGSSTPLTTTGQGINNTTITSSNGASDQVSNQALSQYGVLNGPFGQPAATGTYDGVVANNQSDDFTAYPFGLAGDSVINTSTTVGTPTTSVTLGSAQTLCVPNTIQNTGNLNDTFNIVVNAPTAYAIPSTSGGTAVGTWKVGVYSDSACSSNLGGATDGSASSTAANVAVATGASLNYYVKYIVPAGAAYFTRYDSLITATSVASGAANNATHDELYGGFVALTKSQSVTSNGCPAGVAPSYAANTICPSGVLAYTIDYRNLVMGTSSTNVSFASVVTQAGSLAITDDGTLSTSTSTTTVANWASFATMVGAPSDTTASSTYTYYTGIPAGGTGSATWSSAASKFVDLVGGASFQLVPANYNSPTGSQGNHGTVGFSITVK